MTVADDAEDDVAERPFVEPETVPVRISRLKSMGRSPAHYLESIQHEDGAGSTVALKLGSATDAIAFDKPRAIWQRRTPAGRVAPRTGAKWQEFVDDHPGCVLMTPHEERAASRMVAALRANPHSNRYLFAPDVRRDVHLEWSFLGRACSSHLDALCPTAVIDLKTGESTEPDRFKRRAEWWGYLAQMAFYVDAAQASGLGRLPAVLVAVESKPPHVVTVFELTERAIEQGRKQYRVWFERLLACEAARAWPGYAESIVEFDVEPPDEFALLIGGEEVDA